MTRNHPEIVIIGGGIAGSGLATVLARAGHAVTVVERAPRFIDRIRGEFLHVWGVAELRRAGLLDIAIDAGARALPFWTRYTCAVPNPPYRWSDDFPDAIGTLTFSHPVLQQTLIDAAADAGATVMRPASLAGIEWDDDQPVVSVDTSNEQVTLRPRLLVGADGARSAVRRYLGGAGVTDSAHHAIGGALLRGINLPDDSAHQAHFPGGFAMIFPQGNAISRVYYVCATEEAAALRRAPQPATITERLATILPEGAMAEVTETGSPSGFFPNAETMATVTAGPNTVLIGDAAGSNDPSQGHGLSLGFRDIRDLAGRLDATTNWSTVPGAFAAARARDHSVLRAHARWVAPLSTETGPAIDALRVRIEHARESDPSAGGFASIFATGPAGLTADEAARRHFLGEDLDTARAS